MERTPALKGSRKSATMMTIRTGVVSEAIIEAMKVAR